MEYYSTIKKNEILPFAATWMDLEGIMLSEISQRKNKYCMISLTCGIECKKLTIELPYNPAIPLLGIHPKKRKTLICMHPNVHCSIIYNSQDMEAI